MGIEIDSRLENERIMAVTTENDMSKTMIDKMVDRFLGWKLPKYVAPDAGISLKPAKPNSYDEPGWWPVGTNLLTADQAREMVKYMLADALPGETYATEAEGDAYTHGYFDGNDAAALKINAG